MGKSRLSRTEVVLHAQVHQSLTIIICQYDVNVGEDTAIGSGVFTFLASDPDSGMNGLVTYTLMFSNASEFWVLNSSTGELTVKGRL